MKVYVLPGVAVEVFSSSPQHNNETVVVTENNFLSMTQKWCEVFSSSPQHNNETVVVTENNFLSMTQKWCEVFSSSPEHNNETVVVTENRNGVKSSLLAPNTTMKR